MFVQTDTATIALAQVHAVKTAHPYPERHGLKNVARVAIEYGDSETAHTTAHGWERVLRETILHFVPAQPGTYLLFSGFDDGKFWCLRTPIIGWAACANNEVYPVTASGVNDAMDDQSLPVLHPDGTVVLPQDRQFATFKEWEADTEKDARERSERRRAAAESADDHKHEDGGDT